MALDQKDRRATRPTNGATIGVAPKPMMPEPLRELLGRIRGQPALNTFFGTLWKSEAAARVFFAHRRDLFPEIPEPTFDIPLPFLFLLNMPPKDPKAQAALATASDLRGAQRKAVVDEGTKGALDHLKKDCIEFGTLVLLRFLKKNPELVRLLKPKTVSMVEVKKHLAHHELVHEGLVPELDELELLWRGENAERGDKLLLALLASWITKFKGLARTRLADFAKVLDLGTVLAPAYLWSEAHVQKLLGQRLVAPEEYRTVLRSLYVGRLISNLGTLFWCASCDDDPFLVTTSSRLSPEHLRLPCAKCTLPTYAGTAYELDPLLLEAIEWKDGLLGIAIGWLLEREDIKFDAGRYLNTNNYELDYQFRIKNEPFLLECKMYKAGRDVEGEESNLRSAIKQAARHAQSYHEETGVRFKRSFVIVNFDPDPKALEAVQSDMKTDITKHRIEVVSARLLPSRLRALQDDHSSSGP